MTTNSQSRLIAHPPPLHTRFLRPALVLLTLTLALCMAGAESSDDPAALKQRIERLERELQLQRNQSPAVKADSLLVDNGDGTITDTRSSLMWQKEVSPKLRGVDVLDYCFTNRLAGYTDWKLPTEEELQELYVSITELRLGAIRVLPLKWPPETSVFVAEWPSDHVPACRGFDFDSGRSRSPPGTEFSEVCRVRMVRHLKANGRPQTEAMINCSNCKGTGQVLEVKTRQAPRYVTTAGGYKVELGGSTVTETYTDWASCSSCGGKGRVPWHGGSGETPKPAADSTCEVCKGTGSTRVEKQGTRPAVIRPCPYRYCRNGRVLVDPLDPRGDLLGKTKPCSRCNGAGEYVLREAENYTDFEDVKCTRCGGSGKAK